MIVYVDNKNTPSHSQLTVQNGRNLKKKEQSLINISFIIIYIVYLTAGYYRMLLRKENEKKDSFSLLETRVHVWFET